MRLQDLFLGKAAALLPYFEIETISDVLINGVGELYIENEGKLLREKSPFESSDELFNFTERLLVYAQKSFDIKSPFVDGCLPNGSRFHVLFPPAVEKGPVVSIRKFRNQLFSVSDFIEPKWKGFLEEKVKQRKNILISGGTGSGKTSLLMTLLNQVAFEDRLIILEESREIKLSHPHSIYLESKVNNPDGIGGISVRQLFRQALRMRPTRIIVGEVRGEEAFDLIQAMNSGHSGSMGTLHASSAMDALKRLEVLVLLSGVSLNILSVREWISRNIHFVIQIEKYKGKRQIIEIIEVLGLENEHYRYLPHYQL